MFMVRPGQPEPLEHLLEVWRLEVKTRFWWYWKALEQLASTPGPIYCAECGTANPAGATTCSNCGKMLNP